MNDEFSASASPPAAQITEQYGRLFVVRRWIGCWIDLFAALGLFIALDSILGQENYRKTQLIWFALVLTYFVLTEWIFGRTLGKLLTGTTVVNDGGQRPSLNQILIRTIFRLFEKNPFLLGGAPAGIALLASKQRQSLGDMAANTFVVRRRDLTG